MHFFHVSLFTASLCVALASTITSTSHYSVTPYSFDPASAKAHNEADDRRWCHINRLAYLDPADQKTIRYTPIKSKESLQECISACPTLQPGHAQTCGFLAGADYYWINNETALGQGGQTAVAPCICDDKAIGDLTQDFIKGLEAIGEIMCEVWVAALTGIVDFLIDSTIDTAEGYVQAFQAMGGVQDSHKQIVQGALQMQYVISDMDKGKDIFGKWIASKVCPAGELTEDQTNEIFSSVNTAYNILITAATLPVGGADVANLFRMGSIPKLTGNSDAIINAFPKWKSPPKDTNDPIPPKEKDGPKTVKTDPTVKTTDAAKTTHQTETTAHETTDPAKTTHQTGTTTHETKSTKSVCTKHKRDEECNESTTTSESRTTTTESRTTTTESRTTTTESRTTTTESRTTTSDTRTTITSVKNSTPVYSTKTETCNGNLQKQACAVYYSAIHDGIDGGAKSLFTCSDSHSGRANLRNPITDTWSNQHNSAWRTWTTDSMVVRPHTTKFALNCQRDEWPPAYFMPTDVEIQKQATWAQRMRFIPGIENVQAGQIWRGFCKSEDGGKGNTQMAGKGGRNYNTAKLNFEGLNPETLERGSTITHIYDNVPFTRAVVAMAFTFSTTPGIANDWFLKENECWPQDIVPLDPGFVLPTDDNWYKTAPLGIAAFPTISDYSKAIIPSSVLSAASSRRQAGIDAKASRDKAASEAKAASEKSEGDATSQKSLGGKREALSPEEVYWVRDEMNITRPMSQAEIAAIFKYIPPSLPEQNTAVLTMMTAVRTQPAMVGSSTAMPPLKTGSI